MVMLEAVAHIQLLVVEAVELTVEVVEHLQAEIFKALVLVAEVHRLQAQVLELMLLME